MQIPILKRVGLQIRHDGKDTQYDNKGERWIIENVETPAAKILGEGVRYNHDGEKLETKNSTSTELNKNE